MDTFKNWLEVATYVVAIVAAGGSWWQFRRNSAYKQPALCRTLRAPDDPTRHEMMRSFVANLKRIVKLV